MTSHILAFDIGTSGVKAVVVDADGLADCVSRGTDGFDIATENQMFDLVLDVVVELVTVGPEKLDAVVVIRIVGGGDHNAGVGAQAARDVGDARRGQRANEQNIHPHRKDAGRDGIFEHVPGQTRVFAKNDLVPLAVA